MGRTGLLWVAAAAITIVMSGCSRTEEPKPPSSAQPGGRPGGVGTGGAGANVKNDGDFVRDVAMKNMAQIELSRMALDKATNPAIKVFAQRMIDDHSAAGNELKSAVPGQPIGWPDLLDDKHRNTADELAQKQGGEFEHDYLKAVVDGHRDLAAKLESRLDVQSLADWKTAAAARTHRKAMPEPEAMRDVQVRPDPSDNEITRKINQWAADTYPLAQKHLDTATILKNATEKGSTN
jgi:putative membrane protein